MEKTGKFNRRAFTSIGLMVTSLIMPLSIFMRHWPMFEQSDHARHTFTSVHSTTGLFFCIFLIMHVVFNWKVFKKYFTREEGAKLRMEAFLSAAAIVVVIAFFALLD